MKLFKLVLVALIAQVLSTDDRKPKLPSTTLNTGNEFPMIGLEVDGLRGETIGMRILEAMQNTTQFGFFDTAQRANNEKRLNMGIINAVRASDLYSSEVHVITKVPYTHLGYERTKLSVRESLKTLKNRNTHVHIVLEWPRCDDDVPWMNCEQDEMRLPQPVKAAGPPPHLNKDFAFVDSWRALEDIFLREVDLGPGLPAVAGIGVANFDVEDLQTLEAHSQVLPHIIQKNVWAYAFDPFLLDYCNLNQINFQAVDALSEIFGKGIAPPRAVGALHEVALALPADDGHTFTPQQVVLKWLIQSGVSVTALATETAMVHEYAPMSIAAMPDLDRHQLDAVEASVKAMLQGQDLAPPLARFHNRLKQGLLHLFWLNEATGEEVPVETVSPGGTYVSSTYERHKFVAYDESRTQRREVVVERTYGQSQRFDFKEL